VDIVAAAHGIVTNMRFTACLKNVTIFIRLNTSLYGVGGCCKAV
jgi:hypothetical protein